jgi:hypothetical protein
MREELFAGLELKEEKLTFMMGEGVKIDFFFFLQRVFFIKGKYIN